MLVLSRRPNESIVIGHDIVVTVLEVKKDHVRIGIEAPANVEVNREEVYRAIQLANKQAAISSTEAAKVLGSFIGSLSTPAQEPLDPKSTG